MTSRTTGRIRLACVLLCTALCVGGFAGCGGGGGETSSGKATTTGQAAVGTAPVVTEVALSGTQESGDVTGTQKNTPATTKKGGTPTKSNKTTSKGQTPTTTGKKDDHPFGTRKIGKKDITVFLGNAPTDELKAAAQWYTQTYGGKVNFYSAPWDSRIDKLANLVHSDDAPDVAVTYFYDAITLLCNSIVQSIDKYVDLKNPHFDLDIIKYAYTFKGQTYGIVSKLIDPTAVYLRYNKTMFVKNGLETPIELYDSGKWDWEHFREAAVALTQDTNGDGKIEQYGFATWQPEIFILANGTNGVLNKGDSLQLNLDDAKSMAALQFYHQLVNKDGVVHPNTYGSIPNSEVAMTLTNLKSYKKMLETDSPYEFGFVPFPKGPSASGYVSYAYPFGFCIPTGAPSIEAGLAFAEGMLAGYPKDQKSTSYKPTAKEQKMIDQTKNMVTLLTIDGPISGQWASIVADINANVSLSTTIEKNKPKMQKWLKDMSESQ